jgi:ABC-type molybdate transport system permease subunit
MAVLPRPGRQLGWGLSRPPMLQGLCELVHTSLAELRVTLMVGNERNGTGNTMQRSFKLATQAGEPSLDHWGFAVQTAMALIVIVLFTLTVAALERFLLGDESLSAIEAAMGAIVD